MRAAPQSVKKPKKGAKPFRALIVPGGVYGGGARRPPPVAEAGRSKPNEAGSATSELASVGGREAAGAPRTRSEAKSAGAEHSPAEGEGGAQARNTAQALAQSGA